MGAKWLRVGLAGLAVVLLLAFAAAVERRGAPTVPPPHSDLREARELCVQARTLLPDPTARPLLERAVAIARETSRGPVEEAKGLVEACSSPEVASALVELGLATREGLAAAEAYHRLALAISERLDPTSLETATAASTLGNVALFRNDLDVAWMLHRRALAIRERRAHGSALVAASFTNLGNVALYRGDLAAAAEGYERSLEIEERLVPDSAAVAGSLNNLGVVALNRGDLDAAQVYFDRALGILERVEPGMPNVGACLTNLGSVAAGRGKPDLARGYYQRSLEISDAFAPGSVHEIEALWHLGDLARGDGDLDAAHEFHGRSLAIAEKDAPGSLDCARNLDSLGQIARERGDLVEAANLFDRAVDVARRIAPGSMDVALSLDHVGELARSRGDLVAAESALREAWSIVRDSSAGIEGDDALQGFGALAVPYAHHLQRLQIAQGNLASAMVTLEEARALALRRLISERGIERNGVDPDLWRAYREAERVFQDAGQKLARAAVVETRAEREAGAALPAARAARESTAMEYTRARVEKERRFRAATSSSRTQGIEPLPIEDARAALPTGTLYVAFSVGPDSTAVFLVPADLREPIHAFEVAVSQPELARRVVSVEELVSVRPVAGSTSEHELAEASRELFERLFPLEARETIRSASRLMISPDGPLWELPFAALVTNHSGEPGWLGRATALSYQQSLTVYASERRRPRDTGNPLQALVVGDPWFGPGAGASADGPVLRGERYFLFEDGLSPGRLPGTRAETQEIGRIYGTVPLSGAAASEAAVRSRLPGADVVHLATHGYFHPQLAMSSGILLSAPATAPSLGETADDGCLQAWEILSQIELSADLVVLSACETGRGNEVTGEGLVGLTRAFQAAGARSVLATHWRIDDESASELMVQFHARVRGGLAKDEALRQAMEALASTEATRHPFYWAGFFLTGDPGPLRK